MCRLELEFWVKGSSTMSSSAENIPDRQAGVYQIRIAGHLDPRWAPWFEGLSLSLAEDGETLLTGPVVDQAALHGLLKKIRDLGAPLLSVNRVQPERANTTPEEQVHVSVDEPTESG